ncbi:MAG: hypothetical protein MUO31_04780, partial [Thermodesulfovibrionales bacterium]|nr:hypothetical protein [Thermodesulfovibrionales bacterium]
ALIICTEKTQSAQQEATPILLSAGSSSEESAWCGRRDLNPGRQRGRPKDDACQQVTAINWDEYETHLLKDHGKHTVVSMVTYAKQYSHCLQNMDLSEVRNLRDSLRPNVLKSLSALAKYTGCYQGFKDSMKQFGLTWGGRSSDDIVIDRITKVQNPDEVFSWIKQVKSKRPDLEDFMDFIAVTGLRLDEAFQSYNLIISLARKGKLEEYYNEKTQTLEHYKFKETFIRKSKKAFISFVPRELIQRIQENEPFKSKGGIQKRVVTSGLKLRFSDVREAHASFMTKHLKQPEIDFVHGRVASNVFMRNYFNPALIVDLEARAMQGISEIREKVKM